MATRKVTITVSLSPRWRTRRPCAIPERQARVAPLVRQPTTAVVPLVRIDGTNVGRLLAASGTADIVDAHVAICARRADQHVATTDPDDLQPLDPRLKLIVV